MNTKIVAPSLFNYMVTYKDENNNFHLNYMPDIDTKHK